MPFVEGLGISCSRVRLLSHICISMLFIRAKKIREISSDIQKYPTSSPQTCPNKLVLGISADVITTNARGVIHVGMLYVAIVKYGFVLFVRMASSPTNRKNQTLAPKTAVLEWRMNFEDRT